MRIPYLNRVESLRPHPKALEILDLRLIQTSSNAIGKITELKGLMQSPNHSFKVTLGQKSSCHFRSHHCHYEMSTIGHWHQFSSNRNPQFGMQ